MPNYILEFWAPPGSISPSGEGASIILTCPDECIARMLGELVAKLEVSLPEEILTWFSDDLWLPEEAGPAGAEPILTNVELTTEEAVDYSLAHLVYNLQSYGSLPDPTVIEGRTYSFRMAN